MLCGRRGSAIVGAVGLGLGVAAGMLEGCDTVDSLCGPCGRISTAELSPSGEGPLDGYFPAVATIQTRAEGARRRFEAVFYELSIQYGLDPNRLDEETLAELIAAIAADIDAHASRILVAYTPPRCMADLATAVDAQARCEASIGCRGSAPQQPTFVCEGICHGQCLGDCKGAFACESREIGIPCGGMCMGTCETAAAAPCEGTCRGVCTAGNPGDGSCTAYDERGACAGRCLGLCAGTCEVAIGAVCNGTCHGTCIDDTSPGCAGSKQCYRGCQACTDRCEGHLVPPSYAEDCEITEDCRPQAQALAEANLQCTTPSLDYAITFRDDVDPDDRAGFSARMRALEALAERHFHDLAVVDALFYGRVEGRTLFDPSPVDEIAAELRALFDAGFEPHFDIPRGRLVCVDPAFREAMNILENARERLERTIDHRRAFAAFLASPT